jgi:polysaccharide biosynthesis protein PelG
VLNLSLTLLTQLLGPQFYGYGFALAASISALTGLFLLGRRLDRLEYSTFMLQR